MMTCMGVCGSTYLFDGDGGEQRRLEEDSGGLGSDEAIHIFLHGFVQHTEELLLKGGQRQLRDVAHGVFFAGGWVGLKERRSQMSKVGGVKSKKEGRRKKIQNERFQYKS